MFKWFWTIFSLGAPVIYTEVIWKLFYDEIKKWNFELQSALQALMHEIRKGSDCFFRSRGQ